MADLQLTWMSADELARRIARGELSARDALRAHWERIDEVNPLLNAVIFQDRERAWADAERADRRQAAGERLGALHGVPLTNKDSNDTAGMPTTWGSALLADQVPIDDSIIVARLRAAGAVMTGKNNVPEFAAGAHTFNEVFGATRNPYDLQRSAGGSSGGLASALAAGIQSIGDGSDLGGSLRIPASFCNVVGLRPSRGVVPTVGRDSWAWIGRTGPMAREVNDVALMMSVISGPDRRIPYSLANDPQDFSSLLTGDADIRGLRIAYSGDLGLGLPFDRDAAAIAHRSLVVLEGLGAIVEEASPDLAEADFVFRQARANDMEVGFGELVRSSPERVKLEVRENIDVGRRQSADDLRALAAARTRLEQRVREFFDRHDVLVTPTAQSLPFPVEQRYPVEVAGSAMSDYLDWMRSVCVVSAMDVPAISVPAGFTAAGLPVGIQLAAAHGADSLLLRVAQAYERATQWGAQHPELARVAAGR